MIAARVPHDEPFRLRTLRALGILDTKHESASDAIATAAAAIANVPISAVSLVDEKRQWFKASCGLAVRETGRDVSFCAHVILRERPLIIPDARADERFADNPLVTGPPYIRFYAGFALIVEGARVGALCVIDDMPRTLTVSQIERLNDLAVLAGNWIADAAVREAK